MDVPGRSHRDIGRQYVREFPFPGPPKFPRDHVESALSYEPRDGDIILSTYPKSGTTWVQYILFELLHGGEKPLPSMEEMRLIMPYMEASGAEAAMSLPQPRVIKYHVPYHLIPKSPRAKYIYIIRNPYDVVVSYFHFLRIVTEVDLQFEEFFDGFVSGDLIYGDYFDHVLSWYERKDEPNVLLLSYDKMKLDPRKGLLKIARFLGEEYLRRLTDDETNLVDKILQRTSFSFMKKYLDKATSDDTETNAAQADKKSTDSDKKNETGNIRDFFRKGTVGDWKTHLTQEQVERMRMKAAEKLSGTDLETFWQI